MSSSGPGSAVKSVSNVSIVLTCSALSFAFSVDTILVLGQEKVTIDLTRIFASSTLSPRPTVLKLPKSGGVVELDDAYKSRLRAAQVKTYFYGGS